MGTVEVRLFGAPEILHDGDPVPVDTRKAIAVIAVLAAEGRPVRRDVLAAMLWPDAGQERARANLRRTLSAVRSAIGADAVVADRETIALAADRTCIDVVDFERLVTDDPAGAIDLHRGAFLEGFSLTDSAEFESWQRDRADEYRHRVDGRLARLAEIADPRDAVELARRRLVIDPLNEAACRQAMSALAATGDRSGAIAAYRDLTDRLETELGVEPLAETTHLCDAIRRGDDGRPTQRAATVQLTSPGEPRLVGRSLLLDELGRSCRDHDLVLVLGEPGIGRSRILLEWARTVPERLDVTCHPGERDVPYAPFSRWLPGRTGPNAVSLFEQLAAALPLASGGTITVDDLQLADPGTLAFLTYVIHRRDRFGWSVVATWAGDRIGPGDACWDLLSDGRRAGWAAECRIDRLDDAATRELVEAMGGASDGGDWLVALSEGLPVVVVESMRLGPEADDVPPAVGDLMRRRLASVGSLAGQIVEALAVIGRPAASRLVQSVAGRTADETTAAIDELVGAGIVRETSDSLRVGLTHHLLGAVALEDVTTSRRRVLHERAARALPDAEAADHYARAGRPGQAAACHVRAAGAGVGSGGAPATALEHLRSALGLGADDPAIHRSIGDIETTLGHYDEARRSYEVAAARSTGAALVDVELRLARLALRSGDHLIATSHLRSAEMELDAAGSDPKLRAEVAIGRALVATGSDQEPMGVAADAVELAERAEDAALEAEAVGTAALVAHRSGLPERAASHARRARRLAQLADAPLVEAAAHNILGLTAMGDDRLDEAVSSYDRAIAILVRHGDVHRLAAAHANLGDAHHRAGHEREARRHQLESARLFSEVGGVPSDGRADVWLLTAW